MAGTKSDRTIFSSSEHADKRARMWLSDEDCFSPRVNAAAHQYWYRYLYVQYLVPAGRSGNCAETKGLAVFILN